MWTGHYFVQYSDECWDLGDVSVLSFIWPEVKGRVEAQTYFHIEEHQWTFLYRIIHPVPWGTISWKFCRVSGSVGIWEGKTLHFTHPCHELVARSLLGAEDQICLDIDMKIINTIICKFIFNNIMEYDTTKSEFLVFETMWTRYGKYVTHYHTHIKNLKLFKMVIVKVLLGILFSLASL